MDKKIAFVVVWFGKLPSYFDFWQKTCSYNKSIDFFVFTDQPVRQSYSNVYINKITLEEFRNKASEVLGFSANINSGYKLCDYKVAYGDIFKKYLEQYDYWGYCDIDLAFGDIMSFIKPLICNGTDKINQMGHFCLYKNNQAMRTLYRLDGAKWNYKTVYSDDKHYAFDEYCGMCLIVAKNNVNEQTVADYVDFDRRQKRIVCRKAKNYNRQAFIWKDGRAYQVHVAGEQSEHVVEDEKMYIHFQGRKPCFNCKSSSTIFQIKNRQIEPKESMHSVDYEEKKMLKTGFEIANYYREKILSFLTCGRTERTKWLKQKAAEIWGK